MHTWRYQHSTFPNTRAYRQASDTIQEHTGYKWNLDFAKDCLDAVLGIMAKLCNLQHGAVMVNPCWRQS